MLFLYLRDIDYLFGKINLFINTGSTTGRAEIWHSALKVISDNFLIGLGKKGGELALEAEHGNHYTAHNVFLDVMLWGGYWYCTLLIFLFNGIYTIIKI